jgi:crotonobetainyl-CoA:carnitine CoA-transferase CaiB-like acyl-CoA transferase
VPDPILGEVRLVGPPVKLSADTTPITRAAPLLGEHAEQILSEQLGRSPEAIAELRADGVI